VGGDGLGHVVVALDRQRQAVGGARLYQCMVGVSESRWTSTPIESITATRWSGVSRGVGQAIDFCWPPLELVMRPLASRKNSIPCLVPPDWAMSARPAVTTWAWTSITSDWGTDMGEEPLVDDRGRSYRK
jgi:hypothetical protein